MTPYCQLEMENLGFLWVFISNTGSWGGEGKVEVPEAVRQKFQLLTWPFLTPLSRNTGEPYYHLIRIIVCVPSLDFSGISGHSHKI